MMNLAEELKGVIAGDVLDDEATLTAYSTDASIFKVKPRVVVAPKDVKDLKALVKFVFMEKKNGRDISLTARSGGTDMSGGPLNESIIVDFTKHFNHIKELGDEYVVIEPGVFYRDLEKELDARNLMLPSYPASKSICTVGGMVANNSGGEKTLAYGKTENYVQELHVILSNGDECVLGPLQKTELQKKMRLKGFEGEVYRKLYKLVLGNYEEILRAKPKVSKNSAGYYLWNIWNKKVFDPTKLVTGSQGTLAFVTQIKFRLVKKKKHSRLAVVFMRDLKPLAAIAKEVLRFKPESFESYDDNTLKLAMRFLPDMVKILKGNIFSLALQFFPEFLMVLRTGGLPKLVLLIELTSDDEVELQNRLNSLKSALSKFNLPVRLTKTDVEAEKYWTIRRESFNLLRHKVKNKQTVPFVDDFIVRPERLSEFLPRLDEILKQYRDRMIYTIAGHVGDGNFHIIPLMELANPSSRALIPEVAQKVYKLVLEFGGSITAEHNDGLIRTPYLRMMYGDRIIELFRRVKDIFDPLDILNPRKKVGGDFGYALSHIK